MKKQKTLLESYRYYLKAITVNMSVVSVLLMIVGVILACILGYVLWIGSIAVAAGAAVLIEYFVIRRYMLRKIRQLQQIEQQLIETSYDG